MLRRYPFLDREERYHDRVDLLLSLAFYACVITAVVTGCYVAWIGLNHYWWLFRTIGVMTLGFVALWLVWVST